MNNTRIGQKQRIIFCSFSNFESGAFGDAINDRKLFEAISNTFSKISLFPKYTLDNKLKTSSILKYIVYYLKEIVNEKRIFITRGSKLAILPILLRIIFKNKIVLRLGCTPLMFVERKAFLRNRNFKPKTNLLQKIFYYFEPQLEKFALRHADGFIVENNRAKKIVSFYGAKLNKIKVIPYFVQKYFLEGQNPEYNEVEDYFRIGYMGRFKKYDILIPVINAISVLKKENYKVKLFLIGDGPNKKNIEKLIKKKKLTESVIILGEKPHREVSERINEYHCLLLPMLNKLCPSTIAIKILEGVMKGKVIITTNSGNNVSLFQKQTDLILENASEKSIIEKIKTVFSNYDYYKKIAEKLKINQLELRSDSIYEERLESLLIKLIKE